MAWESAVVGGMIGILFLWSFLAFNLGKNGTKEQEHPALRLLLVLMIFLGVFVTLWVMKLIADLNDAGISAIIDVVFQGYGYVFMFVVFYYIITYIFYMINLLKVKR